jgi:hypothetical protein
MRRAGSGAGFAHDEQFLQERPITLLHHRPTVTMRDAR